MPFRPFSFLLVRDAIVLAQPDRTAVRAPGGSVGLVRVREASLSLLCSVDSLPESSTPLRLYGIYTDSRERGHSLFSSFCTHSPIERPRTMEVV